MENERFDAIVKALAAGASSRRVVLGMTLGGLLGSFRPASELPSAAAGVESANAFGCLPVGRKCRGNDAACCSGRCAGKRPRHGQPDRRQCVAHNTGGCIAAQDWCAGTEVACGTGGVCYRTTGDASFCAQNAGGTPPTATCAVCAKDADCETQGFGVGAACLACASCTSVPGNAGTTCAGPAA